MDLSSIYWPGGAPLWMIALLAIVLAESMRRRIPFLREKLSSGRTYFLLTLRGALYALILFFLTGPTLMEESERVLPPRLLVLVDSSASMGVKDAPGGKTRASSALGALLKSDKKKSAESGEAG